MGQTGLRARAKPLNIGERREAAGKKNCRAGKTARFPSGNGKFPVRALGVLSPRRSLRAIPFAGGGAARRAGRARDGSVMGTGRETTPALAVEATGSARRRAAHAANRARREPRAVIPARAFEAISFQQKRADVSRYAPVRGGVALDDGPRGVRPEFGLLGDDRIERGVARERRADRGGRGGLDRDAARVRRSACADAQSRRRESASFAGDSLRAGAGRRGGRDVPEGVNHGRLHALLWLGYTRERARVSHAARSARPGRRPERRRPIVRVKKVLESSKDRKARRRGVLIRRWRFGDC